MGFQFLVGLPSRKNTRCIPLSAREMGNRGITHQLKPKIKRELLWLPSFNSVRTGEKSYVTRASLGRFRAATGVLTAWRIDRWSCGLFILSRHPIYSEYIYVSTLSSHLPPALVPCHAVPLLMRRRISTLTLKLIWLLPKPTYLNACLWDNKD